MAWTGRKLYEGQLWAKLGEQIMGIAAEDIESSARSVLRAQAKQLKILLGTLGTPERDMRIGHENQQWVLATGEGDSYEVLARHEDWVEFIKLVGEYTDYVDGEDD